MRLNSLALRLFFSATTWTVVILVVTGVVLSSIYRTAVEHAFDRRLGVYLRSLVADVATPEENAGKFPQSIGEPLLLASDAARRSDPRCAFVPLVVGCDLAAARRSERVIAAGRRAPGLRGGPRRPAVAHR